MLQGRMWERWGAVRCSLRRCSLSRWCVPSVSCALIVSSWAIASSASATATTIARADSSTSSINDSSTSSINALALEFARVRESAAQEAALALRLAYWSSMYSPTLCLDAGISDEFALRLLLEPIEPRPRAFWQALRLGVAAERLQGRAHDDATIRDRPRRASLSSDELDEADEDLERSCVLLVREAALRALTSTPAMNAQRDAAREPSDPVRCATMDTSGAPVRLPPEAMAQVLAAMPCPMFHPGINSSIARDTRRLARDRTLNAAQTREAKALVDEFEQTLLRAEQWRARFEGIMVDLAECADGAEGRALVVVTRLARLAQAGWSARAESLASASRTSSSRNRATQAARAKDSALAAVLASREAGCSCHALAELLVRMEPFAIARVDSLLLTPQGQLMVGRSVTSIDEVQLDAWRTACGMRKTPRGWEGIALPVKSKPPRKRDVPFGTKPRASASRISTSLDAMFSGAQCTRPAVPLPPPRRLLSTQSVRTNASATRRISTRAPPCLIDSARAQHLAARGVTLASMSASPNRYLRQMQLPRFGEAGQARLRAARVLVAGCGALGTVVAEQLVRAGVGTVTIIDRDVVEHSNLQRQTLFTETNARRATPKAEAAKSRLASINSEVVVRAFVDDIHAGNAWRYASECDVLCDCLDNFQTRYLLNDCSVKLGIPLIYGGAVGFRGMAAALLPITGSARDDRVISWSRERSTPCLRCLAPEPPLPGEVETCASAGVLGAATGVIASFEAAMVLRLLAEGAKHVPARLLRIDLETLELSHAELRHARDESCQCCARGEFLFLEGLDARDGRDSHASPDSRVLCERNAVELRLGCILDAAALTRLEQRLALHGACTREQHSSMSSLRVELAAREGDASTCRLLLLASAHETLALVEGTSDPELARALVARVVGL